MEFEQFKMLVKKDRSIRRFDETRKLGEEILLDLVELTRYCASGRNLQPLRYRLVVNENECDKIFPSLKWAGYLLNWDGPMAGERPTAYLIQCLDTDVTANLLCDDGIQLQTLTLGARTLGIGSCIIKSFNMETIKKELHLPENMKPLYVLALGYPKEKVIIEEINADGDVKYWRDEQEIHHVPKRKLTELIINDFNLSD